MKPVLEVEHLSFSFGKDRHALCDVTFDVQEGEGVGIVGGNGAGKTSLLWCLLGLHRGEGAVRFFGERLNKASLGRVAMVFQNPEDQLFMPTLGEDLTLPLLNSGLAINEATARAEAAIEAVGLHGLMDRAARALSLGERKRAAIAAALARSPGLLLLDEPTAELDGRAVRQLTSVLRKLPVARLIASHHLDFLRELTSRVLVLVAGRIIADGPTSTLLSDQALLQDAGLV